MFFHLLESSLIFSSVLDFSVYRPFTSLVKFSPGYFIFFDTVVSWIVLNFFF